MGAKKKKKAETAAVRPVTQEEVLAALAEEESREDFDPQMEGWMARVERIVAALESGE